VEFAEHRPYAAGDDPRTLDWRVIARSDRNVVRQYIEETNLRATLAVDVSGSMAYTGNHAASIDGKALSKLEYSKYLAAALAYLFIKQGDAAGLVTFDRKPLDFLRAAIRPSKVRRRKRTALAEKGMELGLMGEEAVRAGVTAVTSLGREGGAYGMDEYLEIKYVCIGL
jgi:uncharacterized protein (DUF58 family)